MPFWNTWRQSTLPFTGSEAAVRDLLYAAAICAGAATGLAFRWTWRRRRNGRTRFSRWPWVWLLLSVAVAAATASLIINGSPIHTGMEFLPVAIGAAGTACAMAIFPRLLGFPVLIVGGCAVAFGAWLFLYRSPGPAEALAWLRAPADDRYELRFPAAADSAWRATPTVSWRFEADIAAFDRRLPLLGGKSRAIRRAFYVNASAAAIPSPDETGPGRLADPAVVASSLAAPELEALMNDGRPPLPAWVASRAYPLFSVSRFDINLVPADLPPGRRGRVDLASSGLVWTLVP